MSDDQAAAVPDPVWAGTVAIYPTPDGGYHLVAAPEHGEVIHKEIPGAMVKMAQSGGPLGRMLGQLFGGA